MPEESQQISIDQALEAILFFKSEPTTISQLASITGESEKAVKSGLKDLSEKLSNRGIRLISKDNTVLLVTNPIARDYIEKLVREDVTKDLGRAGLETLTIILYKGPIARRDIDYIRGVNSSYVLRNLLMRGLIERSKDGQGYVYEPSFELLAHLGIKEQDELPQYGKVTKKFDNFQESGDEE